MGGTCRRGFQRYFLHRPASARTPSAPLGYSYSLLQTPTALGLCLCPCASPRAHMPALSWRMAAKGWCALLGWRAWGCRELAALNFFRGALRTGMRMSQLLCVTAVSGPGSLTPRDIMRSTLKAASPALTLVVPSRGTGQPLLQGHPPTPKGEVRGTKLGVGTPFLSLPPPYRPGSQSQQNPEVPTKKG